MSNLEISYVMSFICILLSLACTCISHVDFCMKWPCRHVEFKGLEPPGFDPGLSKGGGGLR